MAVFYAGSVLISGAMLSHAESMMRSFQHRILRARVIQLFIRALLKWQQDNCLDIGASLAYYALFSLFPLLLFILSIFGLVVGPTSYAHDQILLFAQQALPPEATEIVASTLNQLNARSVGASIVGIVFLLLTSSGFFGALDRAFDVIWQVKPPPQGDRQSLNAAALTFARKKVFAFMMVFGTTPLLVISLLSNVVVSVAIKLVQRFSDQITFVRIDTVSALHFLQLLSSFLILTLVILVLYRVLPQTRVTWRDVGLGAVITSGLLILLQNLVSSSFITIGSQFQSYGVVGGVMVLMLWIYLTAQLFLFGGELTYVYAQMFGSRRPPRKPTP